MRFNSVKSSNFTRGAKAVARSADQAFDAAMSGKPDFTGIAKTAMNARSMERQVATEAEGAVANAAIDAVSQTKRTRMKTDTAKEVSDIKRPAKRMAGIVAGLGSIAGAAVLLNEEKEEKADTSAYLQMLQSGINRSTSKAQQYRDEAAGLNTDLPEPVSVPSTSTQVSNTTSSTEISSGDALDNGKGSAGSGKAYSQSDIQTFAEQAGFSPQNAKIMAAISMGESRGNSGIDTVQSGLDPDKKNEYSIGLTQINVQAHQDKLDRRGWSADDLRDPVKNLTIAKEVYDEVGSFKPWSVYTSGKYNQYLK